MKLRKLIALVVVLAIMVSTMGFSAMAEEITEEPTNGYVLYIYNADGTEGMKIDGTKSIDGFCLKSALEDARVFVNNAFLFGITTPATYVVEMYGDSAESESFTIGSDVTIKGNGHNIVLAEGVELTNNGVIEGAIIVEAATAVAKIGDTEYATLAEAIASAQSGDTIVVLADVAVSDEIVIAADKTVVLDLNGYTVSRVQAETATANSQLIKNLGNLTVKDSSDAKTGKLSYTYTGGKVAYSVSTISNVLATLTVESGTIENNTADEYTGSNGVYAYAIDSLTNGNGGEAAVAVAGGVIKSNYMAIRQFVNSTTNNNTLVVTNGEIVGGKRAINVQGSNDATKASNTAVLSISGGTVKAVSETGYSVCALTSSENMSIVDGTFVGNIYSGAMGIISGGTYNIEPYAGYAADGFDFAENDDGTFGVVVAETEIIQMTVSEDETAEKLSVAVDVANIPEDATIYVASYCGEKMLETKIVDKVSLSTDLASANVDAVRVFVWDANFKPCCANEQVLKGEFVLN